jgi:predicted branched-subunit amino acid permease
VHQENAAKKEERVTFTLAGALAGARRCVPVAISGCATGLVFGTLAGQAGLGAGEAALMSALVFSGAAQFLVLGLWASPLPVAAIVLTTFVVGLRHLLMGVALGPVFSRLPRLKAYTSVYFMADENWALTMGGLLDVLAWTGSTFVGGTFGGAVEDPARWGLDFAFTAIFLALIAGMWKGRSNILPWTVAAAVSVAAHHWLPGQWYILLGGLAGSFAGVVRRGP